MHDPEDGYREISPWLRSPEDLQPALESDLRADVVVIGGGYTGLSTALSLRGQGADVVVLEKDFSGSGASGRNAGHLTPTIGKDMPTLLRLFGRERASRLVRFADAAVEYTEEAIRKLGIDCEYEASGNVAGGVHPKHEKPLRRAGDTARELGARVRYLSDPEMRERGLPEAFCCGVLEEKGGHLHPGRYVMGLRRAALSAGVRLFENSALAELDAGGAVVARTAGGSIRADHCVFATNAYTASTGWKKRLVVPLRVSLFETRPLSEEERGSFDWRGREGIYTAHEALESYRLTLHNTIVGGARAIGYGWASSLLPGNDPRAFRIIETAFRDRFPTLGELAVASFWSGWIGLTIDFLPTLAVDREHPNVLYGIGFAGHGVAQATLMGDMLAERIQGRRHEWEDALDRRQFAWPPEPLRWAASKLIIGAIETLDRRTDRQARAHADSMRRTN